jgi:hypothetical protein
MGGAIIGYGISILEDLHACANRFSLLSEDLRASSLETHNTAAGTATMAADLGAQRPRGAGERPASSPS